MRYAITNCLGGIMVKGLVEPSALERLDDLSADVTFDELALDSLSRLTLAACLDAEHGLPIAETDVTRAGSIQQLARVLADQFPGAT